ncbi:MAG: undecaprenyl-diphosphate phosphatase [Fimbriimonadaceae bacterium]|nr:undecaprenyl-diphosphate phosphatase [Fimbriimonadaceae bacterium]
MTFWQALLLGLLQGLGEFLPISSSGHLKLAEHFFRLPNPELLLPFDVLLHLGTLLAVLVYFRQDVREMAGSLLGSLRLLRRGGWAALANYPSARRSWLILVSLLPTGALAVLLRDQADFLAASPYFVAAMLLVTGCLNWYADRCSRQREGGLCADDLSPRQAALIGTAQGISAVFRGVSRSGSTITTGLALGLDATEAPRFSFLMAIPAVALAALVEVPKLFGSEVVNPTCMLAGFVAAALTGYAAVAVVLQVARRRRLRYFAYYTWTVGVLALLLLAAGF